MRFYWPIAKVDAEERMVWGYASTEAEDEQGETVTREALAAALDDYMRFANIREMHRNSAVGVAREATIDDRGLYLAAKIVDEAAWKKVREGVYKGFSIGGRVTARHHADRRTITGLALTEISVVDRPANPEAVFDCWKRAAAAAVAPGDMTPAAGDPHEPLDYADPGYQPDSKPRYPLDTERHIRAAWAYIHQAHNARRYTPGQLARLKSRIVAAWQAQIDAAGPPAAAASRPEPDAAPGDAARKGLIEVARLARLGVELDWLADHIALAATTLEGDTPPLPDHLQQIIGELCDVIEALVAAGSAELIGGRAAPAAPDFAALARAGALRKEGSRPEPDLAPLATGLAKLTDAIVPRLDALQQRVEAIARTPLPPQAAARGFAGLAKREDAGFGADLAHGDIVAALAQMTDEERTLTLIKAAHASPITAGGGYRR